MDRVQEEKSLGNDCFQKGLIAKAEDHYRMAIRLLKEEESSRNHKNDETKLLVTLLSNLSMCLLKRYENKDYYDDREKKNEGESILLDCIEQANTAIQILNQSTLTDTLAVRSKALYRKAKAQFLLVTQHNKQKERSTLVMEANKELQTLLSFDKHNKAALDLLQQINTYTLREQQGNGILGSSSFSLSSSSSSSASPFRKAMTIIQQNQDQTQSNDSMIQAWKFIHASIMDDILDSTHELMLYDGKGIQLLMNVAFSIHTSHCVSKASTANTNTTASHRMECKTLAMQSLSCSVAHPAFAQALQMQIYAQNIHVESLFQELIQDALKNHHPYHTDVPYTADYITALLILQMRLVLYNHLQQDDFCFNLDIDWNTTTDLEPQTLQTMMKNSVSSSTTLFMAYTTSHFVSLLSLALNSPFEKCKSMAFNLLSAMMELNPLHTMKSTNGNENDTYMAQLQYSKVKDLPEEEVRQLPPKELAEYRKRCYRRSNLRKARSRRYAIEFCSNLNAKTSGLNALLTFAAKTSDGYWRRECIITIGRIVNVLHDVSTPKSSEDQTNDAFESNLDDDTISIIHQVYSIQHQSCTIEEISEIDERYESDANEEVAPDNMSEATRCLFSTSLLLANGDIGTWAITHVWSNPMNEWQALATSSNNNFMSIATEFASAAAGVEGTRNWISSCVDASSEDGVWRTLLTSSDQEVRSGAASTMAKLGLADKAVSSDEGELFALLEVAAGLLSENDKTSTASIDSAHNHKSQPMHSKYQASVERGVELISYLASKTAIKDEITHGFVFHGSSVSETSVLDKLVQLTDPKENVSSAVKYSIACIFASLAVSIETLKKEAFEGKEITAEQYEQMQAMSKTKEELKLEESKKETDDPEAVKSRIKSMGKQNVPLALVRMLDDASEHTLEQISIAMMRMANEPSIRGSMIQQGCLSACIKLNQRPSDGSSSSSAPSSSSKNHSTSSSTAGFSIEQKKLMRNAQHTIAKLLVTTNPNSLTTSQCMGSIQPLLQLIKDSDSSDLQTFEALLSLTNVASLNDSTKQHIVSEKGISILSYAMFSDHTLVRRAATECMSNLVPHPSMMEYLTSPDNLKVWVAFGMDYEDENNMECSRAALGCLAMSTQYVDIALVFVQLSNAKTCVKTILECGNLELMYRMLVIILNLVEHGRENQTCREFLNENGTIAFCQAYVSEYGGGRDGALKIKECDLSDSELQLMNVTLDLAKEIVQSF